jgi:TonB family protein
MLGGDAPALPPPERTPRLFIALALSLSVLVHMVALAVFMRKHPPAEDGVAVEVLLFGAPLAARDRPLNPDERRREAEREALSRTLVQPTIEEDTPTEPEAFAEENSPVEAGGLVTRPELIESSRVMPEYTHEAEQARVFGDLVLRAEIDEQGRVARVEVVRSMPYGLSDAAVKAVRRWRFRPAERKGVPVRVHYLLTIHFRPPNPPPRAAPPSAPAARGTETPPPG